MLLLSYFAILVAIKCFFLHIALYWSSNLLMTLSYNNIVCIGSWSVFNVHTLFKFKKCPIPWCFKLSALCSKRWPGWRRGVNELCHCTRGNRTDIFPIPPQNVQYNVHYLKMFICFRLVQSELVRKIITLFKTNKYFTCVLQDCTCATNISTTHIDIIILCHIWVTGKIFCTGNLFDTFLTRSLFFENHKNLPHTSTNAFHVIFQNYAYWTNFSMLR